MVTAAVRAPVWLGVNCTSMVHLCPGARLAGQWLVAAKSLALLPVMVILEMFRFVVPVLVSVTPLEVLLVSSA